MAAAGRLWSIDEVTPWNLHDAPRLRGDGRSVQGDDNDDNDDNEDNEEFATPMPSTPVSLIDEDTDATKEDAVPPFAVRRDLNKRVRLWQGHQFALHVDIATSTSTGGGTSDPDVQDAKLQLRVAFMRLLDAMRRRRHTDLHVIEPKGLIPAKLMLHTCAPRYSPRYHTAAENALSQCFRVFLETAAERGCRTVALGNHSRHGKMYPTRLAAHIAIRTIRRFMERVRNPFEAIVICTASHDEYVAFTDAMRCYFPRDEEEAIVSARSLTKIDVGDAIGEAWLPEREIQIKDAPAMKYDAGPSRTSSPRSGLSPATPDVRDIPIFGRRLYAASPLTPLGPSLGAGDETENPLEEDECDDSDVTFMSPAPAPDAERSKRLAHPLTESLPRRFDAHTCAVWRKKALCADLTIVHSMKIFHYAGTDLCGRKVLLFVGAHVKDASSHEVLFQCIREIEGIGDDNRFVIIYAYSGVCPRSGSPVSASSSPITSSRSHASSPLSLDFLVVLHSLIRPDQRRNLEAVLMLHPTLSLRTSVHLRQFGVGSIWRKVIFCNTLKDLSRFVDERHIQLPEFIRIEDETTATSRAAANAALAAA